MRHESSRRINTAAEALVRLLSPPRPTPRVDWSSGDAFELERADIAAEAEWWKANRRARRLAYERLRQRVSPMEWARFMDDMAQERRASNNRLTNLAERLGSREAAEAADHEQRMRWVERARTDTRRRKAS